MPILTLPAALPLAAAGLRAAARVALMVARQAFTQVAAAARDLASASRTLGGLKVDIRTRVTVRNNMRGIVAALQEAASEAVYQTAQGLVDDAKARAPVRTGRLRDSIRITGQTDQRAVVEVGADYGALVEYGGVSQSGTPYWTPATEQARRNLEKNLAVAFRRRLGRTR